MNFYLVQPVLPQNRPKLQQKESVWLVYPTPPASQSLKCGAGAARTGSSWGVKPQLKRGQELWASGSSFTHQTSSPYEHQAGSGPASLGLRLSAALRGGGSGELNSPRLVRGGQPLELEMVVICEHNTQAFSVLRG